MLTPKEQAELDYLNPLDIREIQGVQDSDSSKGYLSGFDRHQLPNSIYNEIDDCERHDQESMKIEANEKERKFIFTTTFGNEKYVEEVPASVIENTLTTDGSLTYCGAWFDIDEDKSFLASKSFGGENQYALEDYFKNMLGKFDNQKCIDDQKNIDTQKVINNHENVDNQKCIDNKESTKQDKPKNFLLYNN